MRGGSILWIIVLLGALFFGPTLILKRSFDHSEMPSLRAIIQQEKLVDAMGADLNPTLVPPAELDKR